MAPRALANSRGDTLTNPYGKTALFSTNSSFSSIRTEKGRFSVRIRVGQYTTRSQTSTKHASSTSTNHSLLTLAISSFPDVTHRELKQRRMTIFFLTLHVGKTGIGHRGHKKAFRQLLGGGESISTLLSGPASDKYDIVQPDHDIEKGAAQGRLPEPEAKQRTNKYQPIQILLSVPKRVCNTN